MKKTRNTIVKAIGNQTTMAAKLEVAMGQTASITKLENERDCAAIIARAQWIVKSKPKPDVIMHHLARIGLALVDAIVCKQHGAIQQLAAQVQYGNKPAESELHRLITTYCECLDCGTEAMPVDGLALTKYLRDFGCVLSSTHDNQVPRSLRATCKKIGVVIR